MTERKLFKTILLTVARPNQMTMSAGSVFFSLPVRKFEFSNENKTFDFMWTRLEREVCVQEIICLSKKMSRNQSCIKIIWEFWEVLRATRTKRNVTSVVICFFYHYPILLLACARQINKHWCQKVSKKYLVVLNKSQWVSDKVSNSFSSYNKHSR